MLKKKHIENLLAQLANGLYEKDEVLALTLLGAFAGDTIFLLCDVGMSQDKIAERISVAFKNGKIARDFSGKHNDEYLVVFLENVWKCSNDILNSVIKRFSIGFDNKEGNIKPYGNVAILTDNELPVRGGGLDELWDHCVLRYFIRGISKKDSFNSMIFESDAALNNCFTLPDKLKITAKDYADVQRRILSVDIPNSVLTVIHTIRDSIKFHNEREDYRNHFFVSDRRWQRIVRILKISAVLNDRDSVDMLDCFLIAHCIWSTDIHVPIAQQMVCDAIIKASYNISFTWLQKIRSDIGILRAAIHERNQRKNQIIAAPVVGAPAKKAHQPLNAGAGDFIIPHRGMYYMITDLELYIEIDRYNQLTDSFSQVTLYEYAHGEHKPSLTTQIRKVAHGKLESKGKIKRTAEDNFLYLNKAGDDIEAPQNAADLIEEEEIQKTAIQFPVSYTLSNEQCLQKVGQLFEMIGQQRLEITKGKNNELLDLPKNLFVSSEINLIAAKNVDDAQEELNNYSLELNSMQQHFIG